jgi:hypothetical protein
LLSLSLTLPYAAVQTRLVTTVLLTTVADEDVIAARRSGLRRRLAVRLHSLTLDRELAEGLDPDDTVSRSMRAAALISSRTRRRLAKQLRRIVELAYVPKMPLDATVPLARAAIIARHAQIEELAALLDGPEPLEARGVAFVALLLTEPCSPLYGSYRPASSLEEWLEAAIEAVQQLPGDRVW